MANIVSGFMGGMAGCAMIGQSIINVTSGARTRLSTLTVGVFLLCLVVFLKRLAGLCADGSLGRNYDYGFIRRRSNGAL